MRIVVVHQYYLSDGQPGGSRFNEMAKLWAAAGHDVTIIAGNLNYCTGENPKHLKGFVVRERDGDVLVWRCRVPKTYSKSYWGRMWAFFGWTCSASWAAVRVARPDVVIATSPPLIACIPGWVAARFRRRPAPWIFEIRDLWPESAVTAGVLNERSLLTRLLYWMEAWACRHANLVNVLTPAFHEDLVRRGLARSDKIVFVPNGADVQLFRPADGRDSVRSQLGWGDRRVFLYAGAHGCANALGQLIDAAETLRDRPDILIAVVGDGPERARLARETQRRRLSNILFHGPKPKQEMPDLIRACDVGLAVLQNNSTFRTVYPNKVFEYMACERAVVLAIDGVARDLVCDQAQAGLFAEPENGEDLGRAIRALADDPSARALMGTRGREWIVANASRSALAERYLSIISRLSTPIAHDRIRI